MKYAKIILIWFVFSNIIKKYIGKINENKEGYLEIKEKKCINNWHVSKLNI